MHKSLTDYDTTTDQFLGGSLSLKQPRKGHRSGTDAILLAAAPPPDFSGHALDLGAGVGAAGLALALKRPALTIGLVEIDEAAAQLAAENLRTNRIDDRGMVHHVDLLSPSSRREANLLNGAADLVITNPPYYDPARSRMPENAARRQAAMMEESGPRPLERWIVASLSLLAPHGLFFMIHRPEMLATILDACSGRAGAITVLPVHSGANSYAKRILIRAQKGSRAPFSIAPPLILQNEGHFTEIADAIHRGEAFIPWP